MITHAAGAHDRSAGYPPVREAVALLTRAGSPLAVLAAAGYPVAPGAYVDPRIGTGEAIVMHLSAADGAEEAESAAAYADLFRDAGWTVTERPGDGDLPARVIVRPPLRCEVYVSRSAGHCTDPATLVRQPPGDPRGRLLLCDAHAVARRPPGNGWVWLTPQQHEAAHGPIVPDRAIAHGRIAPLT